MLAGGWFAVMNVRREWQVPSSMGSAPLHPRAPSAPRQGTALDLVSWVSWCGPSSPPPWLSAPLAFSRGETTRHASPHQLDWMSNLLRAPCWRMKLTKSYYLLEMPLVTIREGGRMLFLCRTLTLTEWWGEKQRNSKPIAEAGGAASPYRLQFTVHAVPQREP